MYFSSPRLVFIGFLFFQGLTGAVCAETLNTADYVAIGTSIGIAVLILAFMGFFLCRAQNRGTVSTMAGEIGQVNPAMNVDRAERGNVQAIRMNTLS